MSLRAFKSLLKNTSDIKLAALFLSICLMILFNGYVYRDGYLSFDSTCYLQLSKNLCRNVGFSVPDYQSDQGKTFFAIWPVGYPVMIFLVSKFSGLSVFWASKVLNILLIGIMLIIFRTLFPRNAHWAGLVFFTYANISIFSFTWSEGPFIFFLLCTGFLLFKSVESGGKLIFLAGLCFSGIALFLTRYIGLISSAIIGLVAISVFFRRKSIVAARLIFVATLQIIFACFYLYYNKIMTGYPAGQRSTETETASVLLNQTIKALKHEFVLVNCGMPYFVTLCMVLLLGIYLYLKRKESVKGKNKIWEYFLFIGLIYYAAVISMRWIYKFDNLDFRLLGPGTFMLMLALFSWLQGKPEFKLMNSSIFYILIMLTLIIHLLPSKTEVYRMIVSGDQELRQNSYVENVKKISERYSIVEPGSVVIFGSDHLRYLKDDVIPLEFYEKIPMDDCIKYFNQRPGWHIYININTEVDPEFTDESFFRFMDDNKDKQVVRIK